MDVSKNFVPILSPEFVQSFPTHRSVAHDALCFRPIYDFP